MNGLKKINDTQGHLAGDVAISTVASCLMQAITFRQIDVYENSGFRNTGLGKALVERVLRAASKLEKGGIIYIAVPIGKEHVEFNAHRVFEAQTIVSSFESCELLEFSVARDKGIEAYVEIDKYDNLDEYGGMTFGLFRFQKK